MIEFEASLSLTDKQNGGGRKGNKSLDIEQSFKKKTAPQIKKSDREPVTLQRHTSYWRESFTTLEATFP